MARISSSRALALSLLSSAVASPLVVAQTPARNFPTPAKAPTNLGGYRLGPDDTISVTVIKRPEFSLQSVVVPSDGRIIMPVIGEVRVANRTISDVDAEITRRFLVRLRRPDVTVSLLKARSRPVYVTGRVRSGGIFEFREGWRITQALAAAGGLQADTAQGAVAVARGNKTVLDALLAPILRDPNGPQNIVLRAGDSLRFYDRNINVTISGSVTRPGPFSVAAGTSLVDLISQAGGATPTAALTKTQVRRVGTGAVLVDVRRALTDGTPKTDLVLRDGDSIIVPELRDRVSVVGAVARPGLFPLTDGAPTRIADLLALAGGTQTKAALSKATLRRAGGQVMPIDLYPIVVEGKANDMILRADDTLVVPEQRGITILGAVNTKPDGPVYVQEGAFPRIYDVITLAGGISSRPEETRITISRDLPDGQTVTLQPDPVALLSLKDLSQNAVIKDGDRISVTAIPRVTVSIDGEVKTPGAYELTPGESIPEVIARAGGPTPDAALSRIALNRTGVPVQTVDLVTAVRTGAQKVDIPLQTGDRITLPKSTARITVLGAVTRPGEVSLPENEPATVASALSLVGGTRAQAQIKNVVLFRRGVNGAERKVINLQEAKGGDLSVRTPVQPGDYLVVPERSNGPDAISRGLQLLGPLSILFR